MSEQLYRPCSNCNEGQCMDCTMRRVHDECYESPCPFCDGRGFILVDPCEHGNYDRHYLTVHHGETNWSAEWCPGAGLKETD